MTSEFDHTKKLKTFTSEELHLAAMRVLERDYEEPPPGSVDDGLKLLEAAAGLMAITSLMVELGLRYPEDFYEKEPEGEEK